VNARMARLHFESHFRTFKTLTLRTEVTFYGTFFIVNFLCSTNLIKTIPDWWSATSKKLKWYYNFQVKGNPRGGTKLAVTMVMASLTTPHQGIS
jgi:hypothetical protein